MGKRLLVIGLDGATLDLIEPWIREGKLPVMERIIKNGVKGELKTTIPPITPCAWSSFATGKNPAKHGIYDFYFLNDRLELDVNLSDERQGRDLWEILSERGKKCIVFNVPFTYPPRKINGIMITGFTTPSLESELTYPSSFKETLLEKFPHYQIAGDAEFTNRITDQEKLLKDIKKMARTQAEVSQWLMQSFDWDFMMILFNSTDHVQHRYWHYMDETHPKHEENKKLKEAILEVYQQADEIIGKLYYQTAPEGTSLMVVSDHGSGPFLKNIYLNNWLQEKGYLKFRNTPLVWLKRFIRAANISPEALSQKIWNLFMGKKGRRPGHQKRTGIVKKLKKLLITFEDVNWKRTKAYSFGYYGPIYINTSARGRGGRVSEEERVRLREEIIKGLRTLSDPEDGKKVIDKVYLKEELYQGPLADKLPDIIPIIRGYAYASSSIFPFGSNKVFGKPMKPKTGDHRENGVFLATGPDFPKGKSAESLNIVRVAPTVLKFFGIGPPSDMDGKVITF
jgi:predicted AlkP superfamily phosphohydrolase/phosphomutase